jgi:hypothetical protein
VFIEELGKLVQRASGARIQFRPAGVEQHIAQSQHQSARGRGRLELIDLGLQAGRLLRRLRCDLRRLRRVLRRLIALVERALVAILALFTSRVRAASMI